MAFSLSHTKHVVLIVSGCVVLALLLLFAQLFSSFIGTRVAPSISESIVGGKIKSAALQQGANTLTFRAQTPDGKTVSDEVAFQVSSSDTSSPPSVPGSSALNCGSGPTISLTAACLENATQPYILDQSDSTYVLNTDVTVDGSAFMIGGSNIVLDLNNHTVTYANSAPIVFPNGGFESGLASWDVSGAPSATIQPARTGMWGNSMLALSNYSTAQTLISDSVQIPVANRTYAATVTAKGASGQTVEIKIIDTVDGNELPTKIVNKANVSRGYGAVVSFESKTTHPIKVKIVVTPTAGTTNSGINLDYVNVFPAQDYGIIASPSTGRFPVQLKTPAIIAAANKQGVFTIKNGSVVAGKALSYGSRAIAATSSRGITVSRVNTFVNGMDSMNFDAPWAGGVGGVTIVDSVADSAVDNISDRQKIFANISINAPNGNVRIEGNTLLNSPQAGVNIGGNAAGTTVAVNNNKISQRAVVSNPYGIFVRAVNNFTIANNRITPILGRGISLDGSEPTQNGEIYGNYVESTMKPNLEYTFNKMTATPLRIRNWGNVQKNIHIHDNIFIGKTGDPGTVWAADGGFITMKDSTGSAHEQSIIENNTFKAIVTTTDTKYKAWGMIISGVDSGAGLTVKNNDIQSNDISLSIGGNDNWQGENSGILFLQNTLTKLSEGAVRNYTPILAGDGQNSVTDMRFIDTTYVGGATFPGIRFMHAKTKDIDVGFLLSVNAAPNASVKVTNVQGDTVYTGATDANGLLSNVPLVSTTYSQTDPKVFTPIITPHTPLTVTVAANGTALTKTTDLTQNTSLTFP